MLRIWGCATAAAALCFCSVPAHAIIAENPQNYVINFTSMPGGGLDSIGPGTFFYAAPITPTPETVGPPVTLQDYMIPARIDGGPVLFTQTSPDDDSIAIAGGLVTALNVDSELISGIHAGSVLQLNLDNTWTLDIDNIATDAGGTYSVTPAVVPEPSMFALLAVATAGLAVIRRRRTV